MSDDIQCVENIKTEHHQIGIPTRVRCIKHPALSNDIVFDIQCKSLMVSYLIGSVVVYTTSVGITVTGDSNWLT